MSAQSTVPGWLIAAVLGGASGFAVWVEGLPAESASEEVAQASQNVAQQTGQTASVENIASDDRPPLESFWVTDETHADPDLPAEATPYPTLVVPGTPQAPRRPVRWAYYAGPYEEAHGDDDCTDDCSGHEAGYAWAEDNDIDDPDDCDGNSGSFIEGCQAWAEDQSDDDGVDEDEDD